MDDVRSKMYLKNLAMVFNFEVKRRAVTIDVTLVEGVCGRELPGTKLIRSLEHGIERVMLGL